MNLFYLATLPEPEPVVAVPRSTPAVPPASKPTIEKPSSAPTVISPPRAAKQIVVSAKDTVEPIVGIRKAMSKAMVRAQQIPHFGYDDEVNIPTAQPVMT